LNTPETGADETVIRLFALLHDSCRLDDGADLLHGPRAADMLGEIAGTLFTFRRVLQGPPTNTSTLNHDHGHRQFILT